MQNKDEIFEMLKEILVEEFEIEPESITAARSSAISLRMGITS